MGARQRDPVQQLAKVALARLVRLARIISLEQDGVCSGDQAFKERLQENSLFDYAAQHWGYHVKKASSKIQETIPEFFESEAKVNSSIQAVTEYSGFAYSDRIKYISRQVTGI